MKSAPPGGEGDAPPQTGVGGLDCTADLRGEGARPQAELTWWREGKEVEGTTETVLEDGNLTVSTYAFTPRAERTTGNR
ncbi:hypothetical protein CEXT_447771 [Caerostris extrusa]|uniref:CD80-like immunoglobulin C2-set domain-containing protein n=1 Tax=Caerostris extrusa TaxID=172846 RepID=A0AAV4V9J7_CAEEX|nr:hypothetical protein CEXT_447771 [Caerostris extrusa]